ncbi:hypothetical protein Sya03_56990 [Spirilliplanes yamanashiensis]|uniref:Uncharacterized protein n=2 Tax=Spirilliplanes yamanashiensis TaxID=42233 RepID=A0A8J3YES0_9ACTN|nr:hypothetical protein Sya03_56990 [Spirilliplanes yamanashiensis]
MPTKAELPEGPRREFVEELFTHYREAGRPPLRTIARWIQENWEARSLRGTASTETIRRTLTGTVVPRNWSTVEAILEALCGLAGRDPGEDRWPDDNWVNYSFKDELKKRWNSVLDHYETELPTLPPRPSPPAPAPRSSFGDPWATAPAPTSSRFDDEPPF